jgi:hypothetical protein
MYLPLLHQYGPWVLLAGGILGILQATVFFGAVQRLNQWLLGSELVKQAFLKMPVTGELIWPVAQSLLQSAAQRWLIAAGALLYLAGAVVWFALRP